MSITTQDKIFEVEDQEYGYGGGRGMVPRPAGSSIGMYVPKIHGAITETGPDKIISTGLIINDKACMPVFAKSVSRSRGFSAILKENCNWLDKVTSTGQLKGSAVFSVEFLNGNISQPYATTK